jgi:CRISPR system Cascade subunit CasB
MNRATDFVKHLQKLKSEKAWSRARAVLRRSLAFSPGSYPPAMPYVEPFVTEDDWEREALYLVAALYALKDGNHQEGRTLATALGEKATKSASVKKRFLALLDADRDQIAFRLRHAVTLTEGGIDFSCLLQDLRHWFSTSGWVQAKWARQFYGAENNKMDQEVKQ